MSYECQTCHGIWNTFDLMINCNHTGQKQMNDDVKTYKGEMKMEKETKSIIFVTYGYLTVANAKRDEALREAEALIRDAWHATHSEGFQLCCKE